MPTHFKKAIKSYATQQDNLVSAWPAEHVPDNDSVY